MLGWRRFVAAAGVALALGCSGSSSESAGEPAAAGDQATPGAPSTVDELYLAARAAEHQKRPGEAIDYYRRILQEHPESSSNYKAQFLIGFVFSEELDQPDSARVAFERVIKDYPESEFADDAEAMLRFLDGELPVFEDTPVP